MQTDNEIRRKVQAVYNFSADEFETEQEFNDYLEQVEEKIHQLRADSNVQEIEAEMKDYQSKNRDRIAMNHSRRAEEEKEIEENMNSITDWERQVHMQG